jgi:glycosyltransferase involved in cell wall biosynthesis
MRKDLTEIDLKQGLSVVIPFYNEAENTEKALKSAIAAASGVSFPVEFILANDGSTDGFPKSGLPRDVVFLNLIHSGRIATRLAGASHAKYSNVLFIDARVWIHEKSLINLDQLLQQFPDARFWNGYVASLNRNLPQVSIWETLVRVGWSRIHSQDETIHFGIDDFDSYPKGTSIFLAKKENWINGLERLSEIESNSRVAISDDTALIRGFASISDIWIDRGFSADYSPRTNFRAFLKNARYRGQTFVDSYWSSKNVFGWLVKYLPSSLLLLPIIYLSVGIQTLLIFTLASVVSVGVAFFTFSFKQWKKVSRAFSETIVLFPLMINFGYGYIKAYSFRLGARYNSSTKQRSPE